MHDTLAVLDRHRVVVDHVRVGHVEEEPPGLRGGGSGHRLGGNALREREIEGPVVHHDDDPVFDADVVRRGRHS